MANATSGGGGPHIKPSHRGLFTAKASAHGEGVQEYAAHAVHSSDPATRKQANFARMAKRGWKPLPKKAGKGSGKVFSE